MHKSRQSQQYKLLSMSKYIYLIIKRWLFANIFALIKFVTFAIFAISVIFVIFVAFVRPPCSIFLQRISIFVLICNFCHFPNFCWRLFLYLCDLSAIYRFKRFLKMYFRVTIYLLDQFFMCYALQGPHFWSLSQYSYQFLLEAVC